MTNRFRTSLASLAGLVLLGAATAASAQGQAPQEQVAALKQSMAKSQATLRTFEWIETTIVSMKGEEKSRKQNRCYYGADGKVQKVPLDAAPAPAPAAPPPGRGGRGGRAKAKAVENKKEELGEYMKAAVALLHQYVPPDPAKIQASRDAGKSTTSMVEPGKRARIEFGDYLHPGDVLAIELNPATSHLLAMQVRSHLEKDPVSLNVQFADLPDGTTYQSATLLDAPAQKVTVKIENSGHRPVGR